MSEEVGIGLLGCGTVGQGVVQLLQDPASPLEGRVGKKLVIRKILVRDLKKGRAAHVSTELLTKDPREVIENPDVAIVLELMGGIEPACGLILQALENGKHVVTANKALLAEAGGPIFQKAAEKKRHIGFEASVAGGIPIIKAVTEGLIANRIESVYGIINGTSNYILSKMTDEGLSFELALAQAQAEGYAEADPTFDLEGIDAAHKLAILISLSYGVQVPFAEIYREGISKVTAQDIEFAAKLGYRLKPLAIACEDQGKIEARVHPTLIPEQHLLAEVDGAMNAIYLKGNAVGEAMFYGAGAGGLPTASAVLSDTAVIAARLNEPMLLDINQSLEPASSRPMSEWIGEYYLRFRVVDRPGVLAQIASELGEHDISITAVHQPERHIGSEVSIVVMTHEAREENVQKALSKIADQEAIVDEPVLIRVEKL